jgi:hypothetical protein
LPRARKYAASSTTSSTESPLISTLFGSARGKQGYIWLLASQQGCQPRFLRFHSKSSTVPHTPTLILAQPCNAPYKYSPLLPPPCLPQASPLSLPYTKTEFKICQSNSEGSMGFRRPLFQPAKIRRLQKRRKKDPMPVLCELHRCRVPEVLGACLKA